ncbi:MAG: DNA gyrase C-terminal beta-propeller domain-containing protein [Anaerolineales bacterium]
MSSQRPDLSQLDPALRAYVEALEAEIERLRAGEEAAPAALVEPDEPPTTLNVITLSQGGLIKRTPRHLYSRQRRGGMGIFDLEFPESDAPARLAIADENSSLVLLTDRGRAFRLPVSRLPEAPVRSRGQPLGALLPLEAGERVVTALAEQGRGYLALLLQNAHVRLLPAHIVGEKLVPGLALYRADDFGPLCSACWTSGNDDLFIATQQGLAIRFAERSLSLPGGLGLRLEASDAPVAITAVRAEGGVFLVGVDGRGAIRLMSGFNANKSPGAGGKIALKTDQLTGAAAVSAGDDIFIISRLGKIIRFRADEVPAKEGVVQGVNCMALRGDETAGLAVSPVNG